MLINLLQKQVDNYANTNNKRGSEEKHLFDIDANTGQDMQREDLVSRIAFLEEYIIAQVEETIFGYFTSILYIFEDCVDSDATQIEETVTTKYHKIRSKLNHFDFTTKLHPLYFFVPGGVRRSPAYAFDHRPIKRVSHRYHLFKRHRSSLPVHNSRR